MEKAMDFHLVLHSRLQVRIFIAISKYYAYSFTPYILNEEKSVNATAALRKSMQDTNGYKLQMFCAEFIPNLLIYAVMAISHYFQRFRLSVYCLRLSQS